MSRVVSALEATLAGLALAYPGPGGAVAVVQNGQVIARQSWGWADIAARLPFTPQTPFRMCSITKQFVCATMLDLCADPSELDGAIQAAMPLLGNAAPSALHLALNQSGLRDYWATAMLCGAPVERGFSEADANALIARTASLQFAPGTRFSYCNQNFRLLGNALEAKAGQSLGALLQQGVLARAGMATAQLWPDTSVMPGGTQGYEGSFATGFRPAVNNVIWTGDAGLVASLDDMIAWEQFIDAMRDDAQGLYRRMSAPVSFADGAPAQYGHGLLRLKVHGRDATGHGGALRGWTSFRCHVASERLSVVVMFNHLSEPRAAAAALFAAVLDPDAAPTASGAPIDSALLGAYEEPETGLVARLAAEPSGRTNLFFGHFPEPIAATDEGAAGATSHLARSQLGLEMRRPGDHFATTLRRLAPPSGEPPAGQFHNVELDAIFTCVARGGAVYGAFSGGFGEGEMQLMVPMGEDFWWLPMPRALDHTPPGNWTIRAQRDANASVMAVEIGCWLARHLVFAKLA